MLKHTPKYLMSKATTLPTRLVLFNINGSTCHKVRGLRVVSRRCATLIPYLSTLCYCWSPAAALLVPTPCLSTNTGSKKYIQTYYCNVPSLYATEIMTSQNGLSNDSSILISTTWPDLKQTQNPISKGMDKPL